MDCDKAPPIPVAQYREAQRFIPGVDALYDIVRAILDARLCAGARVLIVGAGGGREIEALLASPNNYRLAGVDPSADMLAVAGAFVGNATDRVELVKGFVDAIDAPPFDAATACLVMHFLPDNGAKLAFLRAVRQRLKPGAPLVLADVSFDDRAAFEALHGGLTRHAAILGLPPELPIAAREATERMAFAENTIMPEARQRALFAEAGFRLLAPVFRGFWFAAWWLENSPDA
jgi:tRNA (cmo5U34)-methyltransferase